MAQQVITVAVPQETYESFRRQAEEQRHSIEEAVLEAMQAALSEGESGTHEQHQVLSALTLLDTESLWQIVRRGAETEDVLLLAALNRKRQREGLTVGEERAVESLIRQHDRAVLIRAQALALLAQRGEDLSEVLGEA
jgi:hypothetical protein